MSLAKFTFLLLALTACTNVLILVPDMAMQSKKTIPFEKEVTEMDVRLFLLSETLNLGTDELDSFASAQDYYASYTPSNNAC